MGERTFSQLSEKELQWCPGKEDNSIALIVKHLAGNMLSRWTNFLTEDGEKSWRDRDNEFELPPCTKEEVMATWEKGWHCLFEALASINKENFNDSVKIRGDDHSIMEAVHRQLAHYAAHVGQIVFLGKMIKSDLWVSLSIPKGGSKAFNQEKFRK